MNLVPLATRISEKCDKRMKKALAGRGMKKMFFVETAIMEYLEKLKITEEKPK